MRSGGGGAGGTPNPTASSSPHSAPSASTPRASAGASPVVFGGLGGEGPSLALTPRSQWQGDTEACALCNREFNLSRRRHHCRVCGACVCASCSPHELRLTSERPAERHCSRCNLRLDLLRKMTACMDSIEAMKKLCGVDSELYCFFKAEVIHCVSTPVYHPAQASSSAGAATAGGGGGVGGGGGTPGKQLSGGPLKPASLTPLHRRGSESGE